MKNSLQELISINSALAVPVYRQIVESICDNIEKGKLTQNDKLPSVNSIAATFSLARGSVFSAYNELRASGIIDSIPGKGYFVVSTQTRQKQKIFLMLSSFSAQKAAFYNAFLESLPVSFTVDLYFHNSDPRYFSSQIAAQSAYYNLFVIEPVIDENILSVLSSLDTRKLYILQNGYKELRNIYNGLYVRGDKHIFEFLSGLETIGKKYKRLILTGPIESWPGELIKGFKKFAKSASLPCSILEKPDLNDIKKGDAFFLNDDEVLASLIEKAREMSWKTGKDLGLLSLQNHPLNRVAGNGISCFYYDQAVMGRQMAAHIKAQEKGIREYGYQFIDRHSF